MPTTEAEEKIKLLFDVLCSAEGQERAAKQNLADIKHDHENAKNVVAAVKQQIMDEMNDTGVIEHIMEGEYSDYALKIEQGRKHVEVPDSDVVPEQYVRTRKEVDKIAVRNLLRQLPTGKMNWATMQPGEPTLTVRTIKKPALHKATQV